MKILCTIFWLLLATVADAATHYIRDGGTASTAGTGSCNSDGSGNWNTANACDNLPATLVRGDTYCIADGLYGQQNWTTAKSGTTLITIKKATIADHCSQNTGWLDTYGDGQAVWTYWDFTFASPNTGYLYFDGATRTTKTSGHGFRLGTLGVCTSTEMISLAFGGAGGVDHLTFRYLEIVGEGYNIAAANTCGDRGFYTNGADSATNNITIEYSYVHDLAVPFLTRANCHDWLVQYTTIKDNYSSPGFHAESWSDNSCDNIIFRWNEVINPEGTAALAFLNTGTSSNWEIYGNVFAQRGYTCGTGHNCGIAGVIFCANDVSNNNFCDNFKFFNNTIDNFDQGTEGGRLQFDTIAGVTAPVARNNLWYSNGTGASHSNVTLSHNWYFGTTHSAESNEQDGSGDPFVNAAGLNWHLTAGTTAGSTTGQPTGNTVDADAVTRGGDGTYDRGAFEFGGATDTTPPSAPTNIFISQR